MSKDYVINYNMETATNDSGEVKVKYCLYARKSMEADEAQALSIESQIREMLQLSIRDNLEVVEIKKESHSAKEAGKRTIFNEIINDLKEKKYNGILTWNADRISRNAGDLGKVVDLMDQGLLLEIRTFSQRFSNNNPNEKFLLMILGSQAKLENDNKVINVKRGLRARCEMGLWPCIAPTGYLNQKTYGKECQVIVDSKRGYIIKKMFELIAYEKYSGRKVHDWLNNEIIFKTKTGKPLSVSNVYLILKNHFYYGTFEYPKGSNKWYQGRHTPLITRELFERVQQRIKDETTTKRNNIKVFNFTNLMLCGYCGSGITAQEKFKNLSSGEIKSYIYYSCTRYKDPKCNNPFLREEELIKQFEKIIDKLDIDQLGAKKLIDKEIENYNKVRKNLFLIKEKDSLPEITPKDFAKYLLKEGNLQEKRELLKNLKSNLILKNRIIEIKEKEEII